MKKIYIILSYIFLLQAQCFSQSVLDEIDVSKSESRLFPDLATEKVQRISFSKRIFIISNTNNSFSTGDFISLISHEELVARAVVAKLKNGSAGIKILKIHSLEDWKKLGENSVIQVLKGDDSIFKSKSERVEEIAGSDSSEVQKLLEEEDLFNKTTILSDDLTLDENKNRIIKQDNIISLSYGTVQAIGSDGATERYAQPSGQWAYQIDDNIWGELSFGQNLISNFPEENLDTKLTNLTIRLKYTVRAPFYSFIQPYLGYQIIDASSPGAGVADPTANPQPTDEELAREIQLVENSASNSVIFGVSLLKRLVPGWFIRADLGSDIISAGVALEF